MLERILQLLVRRACVIGGPRHGRITFTHSTSTSRPAMTTGKAVEGANAHRNATGFSKMRNSAAVPLPPLAIGSDRRLSYGQMEYWIRHKSEGRPLRILEAGCGQKWPLNLDGTPFKLTAIDIDEDALAVRKARARDVDEVFVGDLRTRRMFGPGSFDVIYNSFVLEHIDDAQSVVDNFMYWLAPGGLLVLRIPDGNSVYGFLARCTPLFLHVLYKKYVQGIPTAGQPGHDPYPTHYHPIVSRSGIHRYCAEHGCKVLYETGFSGYLPKTPIQGLLARTVVRSISALSLGRLDWRYNNLTFVIEK
jgi:SAM-dependent methyltransferase